MVTDREHLLLTMLQKGIDEAWDFHPLSYRASELQEVFHKCKQAMTELAQMGSEKGIDRIAYIYRECIRDGFGSSTGIRNRALNVLINCNHPLARFHKALIAENLQEICRILVEQPSLRIRLFELAEKGKNLDPFEDSHNLLQQTFFAEKALRILDNKEELEKVLREGDSYILGDTRDKYVSGDIPAQKSETQLFIDKYGCSQQEINESFALVYGKIAKLSKMDKITILKMVCDHDDARATSDVCIGLLQDYKPELLSRVEYGIKQLLGDQQKVLLSCRIQIIKHIYCYAYLGILDRQIKEIATSGLRRMGEPAIDELIWDMRCKHDGFYAAKCLKAIGKLALPKILEELKGTNKSGLKWSIAQLLGDMDDTSAVESLIELLNDEVADVRKRAADSLTMITKHHFLFRNVNQVLWRHWWDRNKSRI